MEPPRRDCPVCGSAELTFTVRRPHLPAMQNYIYRRQEHALEARRGKLDLAACRRCGFAFNAGFDPSLLVYDEGYDNSVPSSVMTRYYRNIAAYLHQKHLHDGALVLDVGCGKGTFLEVLCEQFPTLRGLGIDPSYEGETEPGAGNLRFIREIFAERHVRAQPQLVVCRHVLEHIPEPIPFLTSIGEALRAYPGTPIFLEVPDTQWIVRNGAYWDFCYEHCNYFTPESVAQAMQSAGFRPTRITTGFGDQYIWVEAVSGAKPQPVGASARSSFAGQLGQYAVREQDAIAGMRRRLSEMKQAGWSVAVWGMATKGVVFSSLADPQRTLIDYCIDVNPSKQGCFAPLSGHAIRSPESLRAAGGRRLAVIVMNPNYLEEIRATCRAMGLAPTFFDAQCSEFASGPDAAKVA